MADIACDPSADQKCTDKGAEVVQEQLFQDEAVQFFFLQAQLDVYKRQAISGGWMRF